MSSSFLVLLSLYSACEHVSVSWGQLAAFIDAVGRRLSKGEETKELTHNLLIWRHIAHYNHVTSVWLFPELSILACVCQEKLVDMSSDSSDRAGKCLAYIIYCAWYFLLAYAVHTIMHASLHDLQSQDGQRHRRCFVEVWVLLWRTSQRTTAIWGCFYGSWQACKWNSSYITQYMQIYARSLLCCSSFSRAGRRRRCWLASLWSALSWTCLWTTSCPEPGLKTYILFDS